MKHLLALLLLSAALLAAAPAFADAFLPAPTFSTNASGQPTAHYVLGDSFFDVFMDIPRCHNEIFHRTRILRKGFLGLFFMSNIYKIKQNMWLVVIGLILLASAFVYLNIGSTPTYQQFSNYSIQILNTTYNITNSTT